MQNSIYLASVTWRGKEKVGSVTPGKYAVRVEFNIEEGRYEASIPAYYREGSLPFQLAIRSPLVCSLATPGAELIPFQDPDTNDTWWVELGSWNSKGGYHDAPSFRHPGGYLDLTMGKEQYRIFVYTPSFTENEYMLILGDLKSWCWRMVVDESCYVMIENDSDLKVLSDEFKQLVSDFNRHIGEVLKLPHCELREAVAYQPFDRLHPNMESLRFISQRGERQMVPGRTAIPHYATPENALVHGMLITVDEMIRPQKILAEGKAHRFRSAVEQYEKRARDLQEKNTLQINSGVLNENIERVQAEYDFLYERSRDGYEVVTITHKESYAHSDSYEGYRGGSWCLIDVTNVKGDKNLADMLRKGIRFEALCKGSYNKPRFIITKLQKVGFFNRDYSKELKYLCDERTRLEQIGWQKEVPISEQREMLRESETLRVRSNRLREAISHTDRDKDVVSAMIEAVRRYNKTFRRLGVTPLHGIVPSIVFLQSPHYAGALSAFRRLKEISGLEQEVIDDLMSLEDVGIRDWPSIYERWCLISLIRVLQEDFKFEFNREDIRRNLLVYCTNRKSGTFCINAVRKDMNLSLELHYQYRLPNGREPDFFLEIKDHNDKNCWSVKTIFDAKSCNFRRRAESTEPNSMLFIDDSIGELINIKGYSQGGNNRVFLLHSSRDCIASPTTIQPWASSTACGGDAVFYWDKGIDKPMHCYGAAMLRPHDSSHLKLLILRLIQLGLGRGDICASCGAGGDEIQTTPIPIPSGYKYHCKCSRCSFLTVQSRCHKCGSPLFKNQGYWTYHDLHPIDPWNIKCWACGAMC